MNTANFIVQRKCDGLFVESTGFGSIEFTSNKADAQVFNGAWFSPERVLASLLSIYRQHQEFEVIAADKLAELPAALPAAPSAVEEHHAFATQVASTEPPHHPSANGDVAGRPWPKAAVPGLLGSDDVVDLRLEGGSAPPARRVPFEPFGPAVSDGNNAPQR